MAVLLCAAGVQAQTAPGLVVVPTFVVRETLTDNRDLATTNRQADAITQVSPGLRVSSRTGALRGSLSMAVNALHHARASELDTVQTTLDSGLHYEALDGHFFVDAAANAGQQSVSAFGVQSPNGARVNSNRSQVTTLSVSPGLRGRLGEFATVDARLNGSKTDTSASALGDATTYGATVGVSGGGILGWGLNASEERETFKGQRTATTQQLGASLSWRARYDLRFTLRAGRARSDALTSDPIWVQTSGASASWQPTDRTDISANVNRAYYGRSHAFSLRHRTPRTVWNYTDTKGVQGDAQDQLSVAPLTIYDLQFAICMRSLNNEAACTALTPILLAQAGETDPTRVVRGGFLASGLTLQRSQSLSVAWALARQTVTLSAFRTSTELLNGANPAAGDLALGVPLRQQGGTVSVSHQLTPASSLALTLSSQTTRGAGNQAGNELNVGTLSWIGSISNRASYSLSARRADFDSPTNPYQEAAIIGSLNLTF